MAADAVHNFAGIAQSVEHFTRNEGVVGSSPISSFCISAASPDRVKDLRHFLFKITYLSYDYADNNIKEGF